MSIANTAEGVEVFSPYREPWDDPMVQMEIEVCRARESASDLTARVRRELERFVAELRDTERRATEDHEREIIRVIQYQAAHDPIYINHENRAWWSSGQAFFAGAMARDLERLLNQLCPVDASKASEEGVPF